MISGIHHFELTTADADRAIAFYRELGLTPTADRVTESGGFVERVTGIAGARVRIVHLRGHGVNLELLEYLEPRGLRSARGPQDAGSAHLCFLTDDATATCSRLAERGVRVLSDGARPHEIEGGPNAGGWCVYLQDPDGNAVELWELASTASATEPTVTA